MINKQKTFTLRYSTISPNCSPEKPSKFKSLVQVREKHSINTTLTKYRSIREIRKREQQRKNRSQIKFDYQRADIQTRSKVFESNLNAADIIGIIKLKLHDNDREERSKTEYTMNRTDLKSYIKKKKTIDFINSPSINLAKSFFPKKMDLIINQLRLRRAQEKQKQIVVDLKRPNTVGNLRTQPSPLRTQQPKMNQTLKQIQIPNYQKLAPKQEKLISQKKTEEILKQRSEIEIGDLSGWQFFPLEQQLIYGGQADKKKRLTKQRK